MEPAGEVPLVGLGESELERLVRVDGEKPGVDSRDEGKHTGTVSYTHLTLPTTPYV